jgi:alpha-tubulin suppressor-like RCC1 family protein
MGQTQSTIGSGTYFHDANVKDNFLCIQTLWSEDDLAVLIQRLKDITLNFALDKVKFVKLLQLPAEYETYIASWFQHFTSDRTSQVVDGLEFLSAAILISQQVLLYPKVVLLFKLFDLDKTGGIRKDEFTIFLKSVTTGLFRMFDGLPPPCEEVPVLRNTSSEFLCRLPGGQVVSQQDFIVWMTEDPSSLQYLPVLSQSHSMIFAMGANRRSQLGLHLEPYVQSCPTPLLAMEGIRISSIASHESHTLFLTDQGQIWSCGKGFCGLLGHGNLCDSALPKLIESLVHVRILDVAVGARHSTAVSHKGQVFTWGAADLGQLGHGAIDDREVYELATDPKTGGDFAYVSRPTVVMGLFGKRTSVCKVSCCNFSTSALTEQGQIYAWGNNTDGQCGLGMQCPKSRLLCVEPHDLRSAMQVVDTPQIVEVGDVKFRSVSAGGHHVLAVDMQNRLWSWGQGLYGKLGHGNGDGSRMQTEYEPKIVEALKHHICQATAAGESHSVCLCSMYRLTVTGSSPSGPVSYYGLPAGRVDIHSTQQTSVTPPKSNLQIEAFVSARLIQARLPFLYRPEHHVFDPQQYPPDAVQSSIVLMNRPLWKGDWLKLETSEFDYSVKMSSTSAPLVSFQPCMVAILPDNFEIQDCAEKICIVKLPAHLADMQLQEAILDIAVRCQKGSGRACICILPEQIAEFDVTVPEHFRGTLSTLPIGVMGYQHGLRLQPESDHVGPGVKAVLVTINDDYFLQWLEDLLAMRPKGIIVNQSSWRSDPELLDIPQRMLDTVEIPITLVRFEVGEELRDQLSKGHDPWVTMAIHHTGAAYAWGLGSHGQLGLSGIEHRSFLQISQNERTGEQSSFVDRPCYVATLHEEQVTEISCGSAHTVAVTAAGQVFSWGADALAVRDLRPGDKLHVLPGKMLQVPKDVFKEGDTGIVTTVSQECYEVSWDRNGERTSIAKSAWPGWSSFFELQSKATATELYSEVPTRVGQLDGIAKASKAYAGHHHTFVAVDMPGKSVGLADV